MPQNQTLPRPESYFFTVPTEITQSSAQAFGYESETVYRVSSQFTTSASAKAFSICKGVVLIVQSPTASLVNLVLKPFNQPISGVNIKYFIYRGLKKSDFFNGNIVLSDAGSPSDLIIKLNNDFHDYYEGDPNGAPTFLAKFIGFDTIVNLPDNILLDDLYNKEASLLDNGEEILEDPDGFGNFELPLIDAGKSLGFFNPGTCAIDVVLDWGDYRPQAANGDFVFDLGYARASSVTVNVTSANTFTDRLMKEQVTQFLDIVAFYGYHSASGTVDVNLGGAQQALTGQDIYATVLLPFHTKNKFYLYIQSDRTRSYNYYKNYNLGESANSLTWGTSENLLSLREYGTDGWPVITEALAGASVFMQLVTDGNKNTSLYGQIATVASAGKNNFSNADDLLPTDIATEANTLTEVIEITTPEANGVGLSIASFNILIYHGVTIKLAADEVFDEDFNLVTAFETSNQINNAFNLVGAIPSLFPNSTERLNSITSKKLKLLNSYFNMKQQSLAAIQTIIIMDQIVTENNLMLGRTTYVTEAVDIYNNAASLSDTPKNSITRSSPAVTLTGESQITYILPEPYLYEIINFTVGSENVKGLRLMLSADTLPDKIIVGITNTQNDLLKTVVSNFNLINPILFFQDTALAEEVVSEEGVVYQVFKLGVAGETKDNMTSLKFPVSDIILYTLDHAYYFTAEYSNYMTESTEAIIVDRELDI